MSIFSSVNECHFHGEEIFWGEISPPRHMVQFYESDEIFLSTLERYVAAGLTRGEAVIVIATPNHRKATMRRLEKIDTLLHDALREDRYITLDAKAALAKFMVDGMPNEAKFTTFITALLERACKDNRPVRAFGEMVALLWAAGNREAALELEDLWHGFCNSKALSLYCAYPRAEIQLAPATGMQDIINRHTSVLNGAWMPKPA